EPVINTNTVCGNVPGLNNRQARLCTQDPHAVASAIQGMQLAIHECKRQFKNNRWNCSALETKNKIPHTSSFLQRGYKETAFSYAIASAGVTHQVALACSLGKIDACPCKVPKAQLSAGERRELIVSLPTPHAHIQELTQFHSGGCDHDINYGMMFSSRFLDSRESAHDFMASTRLHNNRAGRVVNGRCQNDEELSACTGQSGSCSQRICWAVTPDFKVVGKALKAKYDQAVVQIFNEITEILPSRLGTIHQSPINSVRAVTEDVNYTAIDLLFFENSPDYCRENLSINVSGRYCNATAGPDHPDSCGELCCGRGYVTYTETRVEQCNCRFHWCCFINCDNCTYTEQVAVCN
uniref:Protein Wnt n=1 Tax=Ciona savignyi TaxID=51511 RepID=H2YMZ8_CIOSA